MAVDSYVLPIEFQLTGGEVHDSCFSDCHGLLLHVVAYVMMTSGGIILLSPISTRKQDEIILCLYHGKQTQWYSLRRLNS